MTPPSRREFDALLGGLSGADFERFVADLWTARGWDVERGRDVLVVTDRFGTERRVAVRRSLGWFADPVPTEADVLVTADPGATHPNARVVGPAELHRLFSYAIGPDARATLRARTPGGASAWLRRVVAPGSPGLSVRPNRSALAAVPPGALLAVSLVLLVVGGTLLGGTGASAFVGAGSEQPESPAGGAASTDGATSSPGEAVGTSPGNQATTDGAEIEGPLPPGVAADGAIDEDALADAHEDALVGQSYRLEVTYREFTDGTPTALEREVIVVESPTVYATSVTALGTPTAGGYVVSNVEAYANGTTRFERHGHGDDYRAEPVAPPVDGTSRYADRAASYIRWFLSVRESRVVDTVEAEGRTYYWLAIRGDPWPGVENTTGSALVDDRGLVRELQRSYDVPGRPGVSAVVTVRYTALGGVTVDPPAWHSTRRAGTLQNATSQNETPQNETPQNATPQNATPRNATAETTDAG